MPSRDFANEDLFSSRMMSMHNSTHSSQINTVGPVLTLLISEPRLDANPRSRYPAGQTTDMLRCFLDASASRKTVLCFQEPNRFVESNVCHSIGLSLTRPARPAPYGIVHPA